MKKPIFNSLGSNYTWEFAIRSLRNIFWVPRESSRKLATQMDNRFAGQSYLFLKGRDAIEFALLAAKNAKPGRNLVFTQAFTCFAIEEGIARAGLAPQYIDIEKGSLNLSLAGLEKSMSKVGSPLAVIVQHSLGSPADIEAIAQWCRKHEVLLIEDLAQAFGGLGLEGEELGTLADVVVTSFGRDKIIDSVAGGACIIKSGSTDLLKVAENLVSADGLTWIRKIIDLKYPFITQLIRGTYGLGLGKAIHAIAKKTGMIKTPLYSPTNHFSPLPGQFADLALWQLERLEAQLSHRRKIAEIYQQELSNTKQIQLPISKKQIENGSNLRFPVLFTDPSKLKTVISNLEKQDIFLSDRWYRQPVDCSSLKCETVYTAGSCPEAECVSQRIINLPTHQYISPADAKRIAAIISN